MNAGCLFTNGTHVLAGYQKGCISGIGGKAEEGEEPQATALRETLEEIFGIHGFDIEKIRLTPQKIIVKNSYTIFVYSFEDLENMCGVLQDIVSPFYTKIPTIVWDLITRRLPVDSEVRALCLLPVIDHPRHMPFVEPYFVSDIRALIKASSQS